MLAPLDPSRPPSPPSYESASAPDPLSLRYLVVSTLFVSWGKIDQPCVELVVERATGYKWVNFVRFASVRLAPLDVNLDAVLLEALVEASGRVLALLGVSLPRVFPSWPGVSSNRSQGERVYG